MVRIHLTLTPEQKTWVENQAQKNGVSVAAMIRLLVQSQIDKEKTNDSTNNDNGNKRRGG